MSKGQLALSEQLKETNKLLERTNKLFEEMVKVFEESLEEDRRKNAMTMGRK